MGKTIGIDLGTTNSVVAVMDGGEAKGHPQRRRQPYHSIGRRFYEEWRDTRRTNRKTRCYYESRETDLFDQALYGTPP